MGLTEIINMVIAWAPTALFLFIILWDFLYGLCRGLRKSIILLIQAAAAATICITLFLICTRSAQMDGLLLNAVNYFMGSDTALQEALNVNVECSTMKEVLIEYIPNAVDFGEGMNLVIKENGNYLLTIVNLAYNIIFALIFLIVYYLLVFFLFLIYLIFYPQRRYKRRMKKAKKEYKKRALLGGVVGLCKGFVAGLICLSFLGSSLYVITGGNGEGKLVEHSFGDESYDMAYNTYRSIDSYGTTGIYKVLNVFKDKDDQPFYLFAADLVFSSKLEDENFGINENVKFREEVGAYVGFAKNTLNLLIKYGGEDINAMINGTSESEMDAIVKVMENKEFQAEFETLISEFDSQTYFVNLAFSFVNSVINNIDSMEFAQDMDPAILEVVKILFKEGYYSPVIPDERELADSQIKASKRKYNQKQNEVQPYLSVNKLIKKEDVLTVFKMLTTLLNTETNENESQDQATLRTVKSILPYVSELSILSTSRKDEIDPVLGRLYCYIENQYLTEEGKDGITYQEIVADNISWIGEINSLIDLASNAITLLENVYKPEIEMMDIVVSIFDSTHEKYEENMDIIDSFTSNIENSKILGKVLSTSIMKSTLTETMSGFVPNMYIDENVSFVNKYDAQGQVSEYGELHQIFEGLKLIGKANNGQVLKTLLNNSGEIVLADLLEQVSLILEEKDENNKTVIDYFMDSKILHSAISAVLINASNDDGIVYVSNAELEENNNHEPINLIKKQVLQDIFDELGGLVDVVKNLDQENLDISSITSIIDSQAFNNLINKNNHIIEGTIAKLLLQTLSDVEMIVIPNKLQTIENWFSTATKDGEIKGLIKFVQEADVDLNELIEGEDKLAVLSELSDEDVSKLFNSEILHYTISNYINGLEMGGLKLIVPTSAKQTLIDDVIEELINKEQLEILFNQLLGVSLQEEMNDTSLMSELVSKFIDSDGEMLESNIIVASLVYFLSTNNNVLLLPAHLAEAGTLEELEELTDDNLWHNELSNLVYALEELFDVTGSEDGEFSFDLSSFDSNISDFINKLDDQSIVDPNKQKIEVIYTSEIMLYNISSKLDDALVSDTLLTANEASLAKEFRNYTLKDHTVYKFDFYKQNEILALSDCLFAFGIEEMVGIDSNDLSNKVKDKLTSLNKDADVDKFGAGVSTTDLIYNSTIIKILFSKELDKVLDESVIKQSVLTQIKNNETIYPKAQLECLVDSINALNITDMDNISSIEFEGVKASLQDDSKFETIYASDIIAAIISKKVYDITNSESILTHHTLAYKNDIDIYRNEEIKCLVDLVGDFDINNMNMSNMRVSHEFVDNFIYNGQGQTNSYLITATLSNNLLTRNEDTLIIPMSVINRQNETIIEPKDLSELLDAVFALKESDDISISDLDTTTQLTLPKETTRPYLLNSIIIRASMTNMVRKLNEPKEGQESHMFILEENITYTVDKDNNEIVIIAKTEFEALLNVLSHISTPGEELVVPKFTYQNILNYNLSVDDVYSADITRITLIDSIVSTNLVASDKQEVVYDLWNKTTLTKESLTKEKIDSFMSLMSV